MPLSKEELLIPRYKLIANYPNCPFALNGIYSEGDFQEEVWKSSKTMLDVYPHLFKKLQWWEEREIDDLPSHIKATGKGTQFGGIYPVTEYRVLSGTFCAMASGTNGAGLVLEYFEPSTEVEYNEYLNSQRHAAK